MTQKHTDSSRFDEILAKIGSLGRYQVLVIILTGLGAIPVGCFNLANVFIAAVPEYWCAESDKNASSRINGTKYQNVSQYHIQGGHNQEEKCFYYKEWDNGSEVELTACTRFEFDQSVYYTTAATEFNLVCSSEWVTSLSQTMYMLGFLIGALSFGAISDKIGRKTAYVISVSLMMASGTIAALLPNYWGFILVRIFSGAASCGTFTSAFVLTMEIVGKDHRIKSGVFFQAWFAIGYMLLSVIAYALRNFRHISITIGLLPALMIPSFCILDESPRWLLAEGKTRKASKIIQKASRMNRTEYPENLILSGPKDLMEVKPEERTANILDLFRTPNMRKKTLITCYLWFVTSLVYYGLSFGTRDLLGGPYFNLFLQGAIEFPAFFATVLLLDRVGRRWTMALSLFVGGFCCLGMSAVPKGYGVISVVFSLIGKFGVAASFAVIYVYCAELFPTIVRTIGIGSGSVCARIAAIIAPFIALLAKYWSTMHLFIFGAFAVVGGVLTLLLPETLNQSLPETIEDGEAFGRKWQGWCPSMKAECCIDETPDSKETLT